MTFVKAIERARARGRACRRRSASRSRRCSGQRPTMQISTKPRRCPSRSTAARASSRLEQRAPAGTPMTRVCRSARDVDAMRRARCVRRRGSAPHIATCSRRRSRAYHDGATIGDAYVALLRDILEPLEIAVLDVSHPCVARASAAVLGRAATRAEAVAEAVRRRSEAIVAAGYAAAGRRRAGALARVLERATERSDGCRCARRQRSSLANGQWLSSTVLLRPVDRAVAAADRGVRRRAGGDRVLRAGAPPSPRRWRSRSPLVVPRWSMTILEPHVQRILDGSRCQRRCAGRSARGR